MSSQRTGIPERIICAAIYINDGLSHQDAPVNIETGFVVAGRRHHDCYRTLEELSGDKKANVPGREGQGFITTKNRYVDRIEGYKIAKEQNQIVTNIPDFRGQILTSEDLY